MVAPRPGDPEVLGRQAVAREPRCLQCTLRAHVLGQGLRLDTVEPQHVERVGRSRPDRPGGMSLPDPVGAIQYPIAHDCRAPRVMPLSVIRPSSSPSTDSITNGTDVPARSAARAWTMTSCCPASVK